MAWCRRPGEDLDLILSFDLAVCIFSSSSVRLVEAADDSLPTKGDALPSCFDIGLLSSSPELRQCLQPTRPPAMPTQPTLFPATAYHDISCSPYGLSCCCFFPRLKDMFREWYL